MTVNAPSAASRHAADDLPIFSPRLDEILGLMIDGKIPNVGRFCGYCYTPLAKNDERCAHCGRSRAEYATASAVPADFIAMYRRMRKRESLVVNSFAYAGLSLGLLLFIVLVAIAVYRFDASWWMLALATGVFIVGGRILAGLLGGWLGDNIGYDYARRKLAVEWEQYRRARDGEVSAPETSSAITADARR